MSSGKEIHKASELLGLLKLKGEEDAAVLDDYDCTVTGWLPSGLTPLDAILGGGFPYGRIGEIYGGESYGKTTIAVGALKSAIDAGGVAVLIDTERSFDGNRAKMLGIDPSKVTVITPSSIEGVFESFMRIADVVGSRVTDRPVAVVWDSLSQTCAADERDNDEWGKSVGLHARRMSEGMRRINSDGVLQCSNMVFIVINQVRDSIKTFGSFGPKDDATFGGRALRFAASYRLNVRSTSKYKSDNSKIQKSEGVISYLRLFKSKISVPDKEIRIPFLYREGVSNMIACWFYLQDAGIAAKEGKGGYSTWEDKKYQTGTFVKACVKDPEFYRKAMDAVIEHGSQDWTTISNND